MRDLTQRHWVFQKVSVLEVVACLGVMALLQLDIFVFCYQLSELKQQSWRLLTGHWVHANWSHFLLNALALVLLPYVVGSVSRIVYWSSLLAAPILISIGFILLHPELSTYVGLSGALHTLYVAALIVVISNTPKDYTAWVLLLAIVIKISSEQLGVTSVSGHWLHISVMIDAHLYGAIVGMIFGVILVNILAKRTIV